ncbi:hypothetical protein NDI39_14420 [Microcoleus sp. ZQ-A2]|nr:hypothetical protein [Microcoleus sp. FACHB-1]
MAKPAARPLQKLDFSLDSQRFTGSFLEMSNPELALSDRAYQKTLSSAISLSSQYHSWKAIALTRVAHLHS